MRRDLIAVAGLCLALTACGTTVPLSAQQSGTGAAVQGSDGAGLLPGATDGVGGPSAGSGQGAVVGSPSGGAGAGGATGAPVAGGSGTSAGGSATAGGPTGAPAAPTGSPVVGGVVGGVDYSRPATGSPVEVGMMYIKDLGAAAAQFGGDGQDKTDQQGYMKATVEWMNAHGGLGGHRIKLVLFGAEIAGAKSYDQNLQEMCSAMTQDHRVVASVIANITVTNNMATCMQKAKALYVTDGGYLKSAADWASLSYTASTSEVEAETLGRQMAQRMVDTRAAKRGDTVGLVVYDAPGFHAAEQEFLKVAKANGITVVNYAIHYATSTPDLANSIAAVQSATLAMQSRGAKLVASLSSGGMMSFFLSNADQQKYYPRYLISSNDGPVGAPAAAKPGQLKGALAVGTMPMADVDLYAQPGAFSDPSYATCREINRKNTSVSNVVNLNISQRVCQALLLVQSAAKGHGGTDITGTTLRDGLRRLGSRISTGTTYRTSFLPTKQWAPSHFRPMHYDDAKKVFVYDAAPLPLR